MKEVWEITLAEFREDIKSKRRDFQLLGNNDRMASSLANALENAEQTGNNVELALEVFENSTLQEHQALVLTAHCDGEPVPVHVLRGYAGCFKNPEEVLGQLDEATKLDPDVKNKLLVGLRCLIPPIGHLSKLYTAHPELNNQVDISNIIACSLDEWEVLVDAKIEEVEKL